MVRLHVERLGAGRDLVLLHGWGLHGGVWSGMLDRLSSRHRLHVIDIPGHGHSRAMPFEGLDAAVDAVSPVIPEGAIVCGWSLGGLLALRLAGRYPHQTAALALLGTTPCFVERQDWPHAMKAQTFEDFAQGLRQDPEATMGRFLKLIALGGIDARAHARALAEEAATRGPAEPGSLAAGLETLRATDLRTSVARIDRPVAVIHGRRDALVPVEAGRWLARTLPHASLIEIEDAAHLPYSSHADSVAQAIENLHG